MIRLFYELTRSFFNLLFPNCCVFCRKYLEKGSCICESCMNKLEIIDGLFCNRCGAPLPNDLLLNEKSCNQCTDLIFSYSKNESLGIFTGKFRELIHLYKFNKRRSLFRFFSDLTVRYKKTYILDHDILIPMPLTRSRYSERGFNQSHLIAKEISKEVPIKFFGDIVIRRGRSKPQSSVPARNKRLLNVTDKFIVRKKRRSHIADRNILLFDDVLTTGATASVCARALYKEGVQNVDVLTLGRALIEEVTV